MSDFSVEGRAARGWPLWWWLARRHLRWGVASPASPLRISPVETLPDRLGPRIGSDPGKHSDFVPGSSPGSGRPQLAPGRVLVLAPQPFYEDRGTPIAVRLVAQALVENGLLVDILTFPVGQPVEMPGVRVLRSRRWLPVRSVPIGFSLRKVALDVGLYFALLHRTRQESYTCIHAVEEAAALAVLSRPWHRLPIVYDMQSSIPEQLSNHPVLRWRRMQSILRMAERWLVHRVDWVACSAGLKRALETDLVRTPMTEWYFPGLEITRCPSESAALRERLGIDPDTPVVLYAGNLEPYQGVPRLIDEATAVLSAHPSALFVLVGAPQDALRYLPASARRLQASGHLRVVERQPRDKVGAYLGMANVVVAPRAYGANLPLKIFDYMSAGRPIVATDTPGHRLLLDESRAVLVEARHGELSRAINGLLDDPARAGALGASALVYAEEHLHWARFVDRVFELYERVQKLGRLAARMPR